MAAKTTKKKSTKKSTATSAKPRPTMFGSHLSIAGGMHHALEEAGRLEMDCVQVFTKNQRQWKAKPLGDEEIDAWRAALKDLGWDRTRGPDRLVAHNTYLINMGSPDPEAWEKSLATQRIELERCEALGIPLCVAHPGAHLGQSRKPGEPNRLDGEPTDDERAGLDRIAAALDRIHADLPGYEALTCLETTVGSGTNLGYDFQHLAYIREHVKEPERIAFCFDTCHVLAAGYDMSTEKKARAVLRRFDEICGLEHLRVFHFNDSQGSCGSRKDRHAHIGEGECGLDCFRAIVNSRRLDRVPKILETPKGDDDSGRPWDQVNIDRLKGLISPPRSRR